jgi:hypothetical protein
MPNPTTDDLLRAITNLTTKMTPIAMEWPEIRQGFRRLERIIEDHDRRLAKLELQRLPAYRGPLPSVTEFDPDKTPHGSIRLDPEMWEKFALKLKEHEDKSIKALEYVNTLKQERAESDERQRIIWRRARVAFGVLTAAGPTIGWILTHLLHL